MKTENEVRERITSLQETINRTPDNLELLPLLGAQRGALLWVLQDGAYADWPNYTDPGDRVKGRAA